MKELLFTMFKIGCIGFGGGTALVPVIESEVVYEKKLIDKDEYTKDVVVANITPGALPVEVAAGVGRKVCGIQGMLLSAVLMGLPGTFLTVLILMLINSSGERILQQILFASAGVTAYIIYVADVRKGNFSGMSGKRNGKERNSLYVPGVFADFRKRCFSAVWYQSDACV